jgi:hypothetical protein
MKVAKSVCMIYLPDQQHRNLTLWKDLKEASWPLEYADNSRTQVLLTGQSVTPIVKLKEGYGRPIKVT